MTNDFLDRAREELAHLEEEDSQLAETERSIVEQRELLAHRIGRMRTAVEVYRELIPTPPPEAPAGEEGASWQAGEG